jgi:hypothetical protein
MQNPKKSKIQHTQLKIFKKLLPNRNKTRGKSLPATASLASAIG